MDVLGNEEQNRGEIDVFLAYSRKDIDLLRTYRAALVQLGCDVWYDKAGDGIDSGPSWNLQTEEKLTEARSVIVLWTMSSKGSSEVHNEAVRAISDRKFIGVVAQTDDGDPMSALNVKFQTSTFIDCQDWDGSLKSAKFGAVVCALIRDWLKKSKYFMKLKRLKEHASKNEKLKSDRKILEDIETLERRHNADRTIAFERACALCKKAAAEGVDLSELSVDDRDVKRLLAAVGLEPVEAKRVEPASLASLGREPVRENKSTDTVYQRSASAERQAPPSVSETQLVGEHSRIEVQRQRTIFKQLVPWAALLSAVVAAVFLFIDRSPPIVNAPSTPSGLPAPPPEPAPVVSLPRVVTVPPPAPPEPAPVVPLPRVVTIPPPAPPEPAPVVPSPIAVPNPPPPPPVANQTPQPEVFATDLERLFRRRLPVYALVTIGASTDPMVLLELPRLQGLQVELVSSTTRFDGVDCVLRSGRWTSPRCGWSLEEGGKRLRIVGSVPNTPHQLSIAISAGAEPFPTEIEFGALRMSGTTAPR